MRPCYLYNVMMTSSNGNIFRVTGPLCGEFTGPGELPTQRPVMRSFDVFFDLRLNKRLSKQPWGWWFETPVWSLWRHRNGEFRYWWDMLRHPVTFLLHSLKYPWINYRSCNCNWSAMPLCGTLCYIWRCHNDIEIRGIEKKAPSLWVAREWLKKRKYLMYSFAWFPQCFRCNYGNADHRTRTVYMEGKWGVYRAVATISLHTETRRPSHYMWTQ